MKAGFPWLTFGCVALAWVIYLAPASHSVLLLERAAVLRGEIWRVATGQWVHFSLAHLAADTAVVAACGLWMERQWPRLFRALLAGSTLVVGVAVLVLSRDTLVYGGLSGIGLALLTCCLMLLWEKTRSPAALGGLFLLTAKLASQAMGWHGVPVLLPAGVHLDNVSHLAGAGCGVAVWLGFRHRVGVRQREGNAPWIV